MRYADYQADLDKMYESEVLGETIFAVAARFSRGADRRRKWLRLKDLETQTFSRIVAYLKSTSQSAKSPAATKLQGALMGSALGLMPWRTAMSLLEEGTKPFLNTFERLLQNCDGVDREFFAYVVAHERAIAEFARREQAGQPEASLEPVESLLIRH